MRLENKVVGALAYDIWFQQDSRVEGGLKGYTTRGTEVSLHVARISRLFGCNYLLQIVNGSVPHRFFTNFPSLMNDFMYFTHAGYMKLCAYCCLCCLQIKPVSDFSKVPGLEAAASWAQGIDHDTYGWDYHAKVGLPFVHAGPESPTSLQQGRLCLCGYSIASSHTV